MRKKSIRLDTTEWARWSTGNCARNLNLIIRTNGICTTQNLSWRKSVTYWPSTEPSIKRCICENKRKNSGSRWESNKNVTRTQRAWVIEVGASWGQDAEVRASGRKKALVPQWPTVEQPQPRWRRSAAMVARRTLGQNNSLSPSPTHLSHTRNINPLENKVWEIYFYKEVCSFVPWSSFIIIDDVSAYICIYIRTVVICMRLYKKRRTNSFGILRYKWIT